jgi:hypothetical protein
MLKRFDWPPRCGVLAVLFILLPAADLSAQPHPPPGQSGTQEKDAPVQAALTPPDSIAVPDGTPLTLQFVSELSSGTAKVGDTVKLTIPYPLRVNALVVVPRGTAVSGTVVQVSHPHKPSRNGQVKVAVEKLVLPNGEIAALRPSKSASGKPKRMAARPEPGDLGVGTGLLAAAIDPITAAIVLPFALFTKGHELVYPAGTRTTVYFNGPLNLDRAALLRFQPPPYKGPAQVFFNDTSGGYFDALFCGDVHVGPHAPDGPIAPLRLALNPGTYSFTARLDRDFFKPNKKSDKAELESKLKAKPVQLEVLEDHQYWIQKERRGLVAKDPQQHLTEFDLLESDSRVTKMDFTTLPLQASCPQVTRP